MTLAIAAILVWIAIVLVVWAIARSGARAEADEAVDRKLASRFRRRNARAQATSRTYRRRRSGPL